MLMSRPAPRRWPCLPSPRVVINKDKNNLLDQKPTPDIIGDGQVPSFFLLRARAQMDGLIPFVLKALKKKKAIKHYRSLSSTDHLAHADFTELSPQGPFFMTPQHPRAPRWHGGDSGDIFMTPQHPRAPRWLDDEDHGNGEPPAPAAAVPAAMVRAKSSNTRRLPTMETSPLTAGHERELRYSGSYHGGK